MKALALSSLQISLLVSLLVVTSAANASESFSGSGDVDVIAVARRDPAMKPYVMAVLTERQRERLLAASLKKHGFEDSTPPAPPNRR
jgi:hypothetical protein